jgi:hypothetical protein
MMVATATVLISAMPAHAQYQYFAGQAYRYAAPVLQGMGRCPGCAYQMMQQHGPGFARGLSAMGGPMRYETTPMLPRGYYAAPPSFGYGFRR